MAKLTVKDLKARLEGVPDSALVVFQGNERSEEDAPNDEPSYTSVYGYVYEGFLRGSKEFVIDCAITDRMR